MKEKCTWKLFTPDEDFYVDGDGILRSFTLYEKPDDWEQINRETLKLMKGFGYNVSTAAAMAAAFHARLGYPWSDCLQHFKKRGVVCQKRKEERALWSQLRDAFQGRVLGLSSDIDFRTDRDFAVRVLLKTGPYAEQVAFVKENRRGLYEFIKRELSLKTRVMNRIGSFGLYQVASITVTRSSEVEFIFSMKEEAIGLL